MFSRTSLASWDFFTITSLSFTAVCILRTLDWFLRVTVCVGTGMAAATGPKGCHELGCSELSARMVPTGSSTPWLLWLLHVGADAQVSPLVPEPGLQGALCSEPGQTGLWCRHCMVTAAVPAAPPILVHGAISML